MTATFEIKVDGETYAMGSGPDFQRMKSISAPYIEQALEDAKHSLTVKIEVKG